MALIKKGGSKGKSSSKGSSKGSRVITSFAGSSRKGKGKGSSGGSWVFIPDNSSKGGKSRGKGKSKGKSKGKGKGKKFAASVGSAFWEKKEDSENRQILGEKAYNGTIQRYQKKFGYGFILPDNPAALPGKVKSKLAAAVKAAEAAGKDVSDKNALYFRKPDVNHDEGFRLSEEGTPCTFKVYVDDKGAGACDVSQA
jgi:cold shock CspA family protein